MIGVPAPVCLVCSWDDYNECMMWCTPLDRNCLWWIWGLSAPPSQSCRRVSHSPQGRRWCGCTIPWCGTKTPHLCSRNRMPTWDLWSWDWRNSEKFDESSHNTKTLYTLPLVFWGSLSLPSANLSSYLILTIPFKWTWVSPSIPSLSTYLVTPWSSVNCCGDKSWMASRMSI